MTRKISKNRSLKECMDSSSSIPGKTREESYIYMEMATASKRGKSGERECEASRGSLIASLSRGGRVCVGAV